MNFQLLAPQLTSPFTQHIGPILGRWADTGPEVAFKVESHHLNVTGVCHGAMLLAFLDIVIVNTAVYAVGGKRRGVTKSLTDVIFHRPIKLNEFVIGVGSHSGTTVEKGRVNVSVDISLRNESGKSLLTAKGVLSAPSEDEPDFNIRDYFT